MRCSGKGRHHSEGRCLQRACSRWLVELSRCAGEFFENGRRLAVEVVPVRLANRLKRVRSDKDDLEAFVATMFAFELPIGLDSLGRILVALRPEQLLLPVVVDE